MALGAGAVALVLRRGLSVSRFLAGESAEVGDAGDAESGDESVRAASDAPAASTATDATVAAPAPPLAPIAATSPLKAPAEGLRTRFLLETFLPEAAQILASLKQEYGRMVEAVGQSNRASAGAEPGTRVSCGPNRRPASAADQTGGPHQPESNRRPASAGVEAEAHPLR